ncbi:MAG TPA: thiol:disulfide interchange protein DsbA/DsbL [Xanthomonadaceae bacterium]|nr:thiol:disulfide interchange protein DsbA/DsbL [Xanthomonadaceae bacterium]
MLKCLMFALVAGLAASAPVHGQALVEKYQAGVHYFPVEPAQPTSSGDKVEVLEVFSYACVVCARIEPLVDSWKRTLPAGAHFGYLPAAWSPPWEAAARAYYAAEALGVRERAHLPLYQAMHAERRPLDTIEALAQWYAGYGVSSQDFLAAARSFAVDARIRRSQQLLPRYGVDGTPAFIVAGKYRVTGTSAGSYEQLFEVIDFLVAKEAGSR